MKAIRRLLYWLRSRREAAALGDELEFHRAEVQRRLESCGWSASDAAAESRRAMGNITLAREEARDAWAIRTIDVFWRDVRCGARALAREPTFTITAVLTLTIGVAATTTVFSVVHAELWKPLPFRSPDRLVEVYSTPGANSSHDMISGADLLEWRAGAPAFESLAAYGSTTPRALQRDVTDSVLATEVTWNLFRTQGRSAVAGRTFVEDDARSGAIVLTDRAWRRLYDGDASIVGSGVRLDGRQMRIVGIVAAVDVDGPDADAYVAIDETSAVFRDRNQPSLAGATGRLRQDATLAEAGTQLQAVGERIAKAYPTARAGHQVRVEDFRSYYSRSDARPLYFFLGAAVLVLVLTCVNVTGLLLARALKRRSEFAIRGALGGGMGALLRQLVIEGCCLALPAAAGALLLARWGIGVLSTAVPPDYLYRPSELAIDWRVCGFALLIAIATAMVFGLAPTVAARRIDLSSTLGDGARTAGATPAQSRLRGLLLSAQIALSLVLLVAAGLFLRSYAALTREPVGFDPSGRISLLVALSGDRYTSADQRLGYAVSLQEAALSVPGIEQATVATSSPLNSGHVIRFAAGEQSDPREREAPTAIIRATTPGYFALLGMRLLRGREFEPSDTAASARVAIINEVLAQRFFPGESPIGRTLEILPGQRTPWTRHPGALTIVGVAANAKEVGLNEVEFSDVYVPFAQMPAPQMELIAKTALPLNAIAAPLRKAVAQVDPQVPLRRVTGLDSRVDTALREDRFNLVVMAGFACVGLLLAAMGIYGAVAYAAEQRRREFGVRLALGADGNRLVRMALSQALRIAAIGAGAGLVIALAVAKILGNALYLVPKVHNGLLFGVTTSDPIALAGAVLLLIAVTLLASVVPARRIAHIDPVTSLRQ
jgi:putative ABC transport system permease protein